METETKIKTASVRIMLSHSYCNFEISATLENENGISTIEIENCRQTCQALATDAVNDYKRSPIQNPKEELERITKKVDQIKADISEKKDGTITDPKEVAKIEKMPLYSETKAKK